MLLQVIALPFSSLQFLLQALQSIVLGIIFAAEAWFIFPKNNKAINNIFIRFFRLIIA